MSNPRRRRKKLLRSSCDDADPSSRRIIRSEIVPADYGQYGGRVRVASETSYAINTFSQISHRTEGGHSTQDSRRDCLRSPNGNKNKVNRPTDDDHDHDGVVEDLGLSFLLSSLFLMMMMMNHASGMFRRLCFRRNAGSSFVDMRSAMDHPSAPSWEGRR